MTDHFDEGGVVVSDEFSVTTMEGVPYGAITLFDLFEDIGKRISMWVVAQSGEEGMPVEGATEMIEDAANFIAGGIVGIYSEDDLRAVRVSRVPLD